jgi:hypothetical protein
MYQLLPKLGHKGIAQKHLLTNSLTYYVKELVMVVLHCTGP